MPEPATSLRRPARGPDGLPSRAVFFGPPGAGKGTQANIIVAHYDVPVMDMGATIRKAIKEGNGAGGKAKAFVERGELVPSEIVIEMALERLRQPEFTSSWLLDGFPRSVVQADALTDYIQSSTTPGHFMVVNFHADPEALVQRLSERLLCPSCAAVFNLSSNPPTRPDTCDNCGHHGLSRRKDDEPEVIRTRLKVYTHETQPLIDYYNRRGVLVTIDALQDISLDRRAADERS
ncbi:MAG: nucleoside monophosphate kinase, partial [bacterium]